MKGKGLFLIVSAALIIGAFFITTVMENRFYYKAAYVVLQYIVLATAWNILGGYTGYVNFGTAGFFAMGAYTAVALIKAWNPPLFVLLVSGGAVSGLPQGVDRVVLNPPRAGLSAGVAMQLTRRAPQRLTYLSCHAATLARDLKVLEARFDIESLDFFDLFPQTGHLEALVQLVAR